MTGIFGRFIKSLAIAVPTALLLVGPPAQAQTGYTATRHPIVLVHGLFGFDSVLGIDYFYGIPDALRQSGAKVYVAQVSAANSTEVRGEQLLAQVKNILALSGASKVNLIGHSHGGPTIRYVAGVAPQLVASATSVAGVNRGSRVADIVRGVAPAGSVSETVASTAATALVGMINLLSGGTGLQQMPTAALDSLTTQGSAKFNQKFPQGIPADCGNGAELVSGVRYYSWTGTKTATNLLDPSDAFLVTLCSQRFSEFELHARAILGLPVDVSLAEPGASAVIYGGMEAAGIAFEGVAEALAVPRSDIRLFGKPEAFARRRMGVAVANGADVDEARARAKLAAGKVRPVQG